MDELVRSMSLCNLKCQNVNLALEEVQRMGKLSGYEKVPAMPVSHSIMKPFCFRVSVKKETSLYKEHSVDFVSVSVPPDAMGNRASDGVSGLKLPETIEILLFKGDDPYYDYPGLSDVMRFWEPQDLVDALNKLSQCRSFNDDWQDSDDEDDEKNREEDLDDIDE
jgi:hypothetical protein